MEEDGTCSLCKEPISDLGHKNTVNHRFHFLKWAYNHYRKALINDRHGITVHVSEEKRNNFNFELQRINGKLKTKVTPEQLSLHNNTINFKCEIKNNRRDPIYITSINLLHPSSYFHTLHLDDFGENELTLIKLQPGALYKFKIVFNTNTVQYASYKIPLACCFQTDDNKDCFTIVRTFLVIVDDRVQTKEQKIKSPFTNQTWNEVTKLIPTTKSLTYTDAYPIPAKYKQLVTHGLQRFEGMKVNDEDALTELNKVLRKLAKENYNKYWHVVLWIEERAQELMLKKYNMECVHVQLQAHDIVELEVPGLAEKRPSIIPGDFIKIRISGDHTAYKGFVSKVNEKTIEISHLDDEFIETLKDNPTYEMDVSFLIGRIAFERMHNAVDKIMETRIVEKLFPHNKVQIGNPTVRQLKNSEYFNKTIIDNNEQKTAVNKIINNPTYLPYIIFGPPGTGKSITIIEAILQIKKRTKKKILVCAPANSACDMLASKLIPYCTKKELLRIHSSTRERTTITEELASYSNIMDDEFTKVDVEKLMTYRIIVTTLVLIGRFVKYNYHPDCVFIDEAAQACEPETDIPIALVTPGQEKQIILAGDPKQLGPMATKCSEKYGLGKSLLERLMEYDIYKKRRDGLYDTNFITMLRLNFRSYPDILIIPNKLFYDGLLESRSTEAQKDPIVDYAIYPTIENRNKNVGGRAIEFCSISAKDQKEGFSPSFFNLFEMKMVVKYVQALMRLNLPEGYKVRSDQIGVVTPYKRQVHKIQESLRHNGFSHIEVGTTESFQGREKRVIIISTVRAQHSQLLLDRKYNLGFVKNDRRFNVALTRAISKVIVIGCPLVLRTDKKWESYMDLCDSYKTYFGNLFEKDDEEFRKNVLERNSRFKHQDDQYNN